VLFEFVHEAKGTALRNPVTERKMTSLAFCAPVFTSQVSAATVDASDL
jgi:hypothetical protein